MSITATTFGARVSFLFEKHSKTYQQYVAVSIAEEKDAQARKDLQRNQLRWVAGRAGV